ncbi:MAG TPA: ABC transporter permease [Cyclobacteriaceae bacterium]|nr:ABC transporter permease [Cyclobacteriaceae bacterium]
MINPPRQALAFLRWFCREDYLEEIEGDLSEVFRKQHAYAPRKAKLKFTWSVVCYFRPQFIKSFKNQYPSNSYGMYKSYFKAAIQNMVKNKLHAFINISGLAIGMAVAIIISLWIYDEVSFNKQYSNHARIGQVIQNVTNNGQVETWENIPWPLGDEIRKNYATDFKYVTMASHNYDHSIAIDKEKYSRTGMFVEPDFFTMFGVELTAGTLPDKDPSSILLSESTAKAFFGDKDPVGKMLIMDGVDFQVSGVYKDFPKRSVFEEVFLIAQWSKMATVFQLDQMQEPWRPNAFLLYVMLNDNANFQDASVRIKDAKFKNVSEALQKKKPELFIHAMDDWRLRAQFENGKQAGGLIQYVWMFSTVGIFVLLMACINFMNLSTARSEKRAKEVGIRKAIGSYRSQLITQFFSESVLTAFLSLLLSVGLAQLLLPIFNNLAEKQMSIPYGNPSVWVGIVAASLFIGLIAGSYPALYLSSIRPVGALKGAFKAGRGASLPRKVLVVVQFSVSVVMIIGTSTVYMQIQHGKDRPLGYNVSGLISVSGSTQQVHDHFDAIRKKLMDDGSIIEMSESGAPSTSSSGSSSRIDWSGKDPDLSIDFNTFLGSYEYGETIQWEILQGRDFSRDFLSDSSAVILNEAAAKYLEKENIIGETMMVRDAPYKIIGLVKDVVFGNPYQPVRPSLYFLSNFQQYFVMFRLNPEKPAKESLAKIETAMKPHMNGEPFSFKFQDESQARKFGDEERVSTLVGTFAGLAIFISCLGIFGLSSFVAEQRTKEIGIRKVLGASSISLWGMLSKDFVGLVTISCVVAIPIAWYFMQQWLMSYEYRTPLSWWLFVLPAIGALLITLATVSFQTIKATMVNPVKSLRSE